MSGDKNMFELTLKCAIEKEKDLNTLRKLTSTSPTPSSSPSSSPTTLRTPSPTVLSNGSRVRRVGSRLSITMKTIMLEINQLPKLPKHPNRPMSRGVQKARHRK